MKKIICFLLLFLLLSADAACAESGSASDSSMISGLADLDGKRIGVPTATTFDRIVRDALPDAHISYFNNNADLAAAMEAL